MFSSDRQNCLNVFIILIYGLVWIVHPRDTKSAFAYTASGFQVDSPGVVPARPKRPLLVLFEAIDVKIFEIELAVKEGQSSHASKKLTALQPLNIPLGKSARLVHPFQQLLKLVAALKGVELTVVKSGNEVNPVHSNQVKKKTLPPVVLISGNEVNPVHPCQAY